MQHACAHALHRALLQVLGHFAAKLDPLGLDPRPVPQELDPAFYGFKETDLDRE